MPWRELLKKITDHPETDSSPAKLATRTLPPHMQRLVAERKRPEGDHARELSARLARLERDRLATIYDVEQGELAAAADNPWRERVALLTAAMETVEVDLTRVRQVAPAPFYPLLAQPIIEPRVTTEPVAAVAFTVGEQRFHYAEDRDWAERGHQLAQSELRLRQGDLAALIPPDVPAELREPLRAHLDESLFVFASDMRDRTLDQEALPEHPTLADLARPCPVCGGWVDWLGRCQICRQREAAMQGLRREENRLLSERAREAEERHRLAERLPVSRRRLRDIETEIEALQAKL